MIPAAYATDLPTRISNYAATRKASHNPAMALRLAITQRQSCRAQVAPSREIPSHDEAEANAAYLMSSYIESGR